MYLDQRTAQLLRTSEVVADPASVVPLNLHTCVLVNLAARIHPIV
jgi:hypothetical protein